MIEPACILCSKSMTTFSEFDKFRSITSDRRPWDSPASIGWCDHCGLIQRPRTQKWIADCQIIYESYDQSGQRKITEQPVLMANTNIISSRSMNILKQFKEAYLKNVEGNWLDFGCGQGHLLRNCHELFPQMTLYGTDANRKKKETINAIAGAQFLPDLYEIDKDFDVITMFHVLEHLTQPVEALDTLKKRLSRNGLLLVQVPNPARNPFDLVIYDHGTFFRWSSLYRILETAGFEVIGLHDDWIEKELTVVCKVPVGEKNTKSVHSLCSELVSESEMLHQQASYLSLVVETARLKSAEGKITIFGSSNGATWLVEEIGLDNVARFLDEDEQLWGSTMYDKEIIPPTSENIKDAVFSVDKNTMMRIMARY